MEHLQNIIPTAVGNAIADRREALGKTSASTTRISAEEKQRQMHKQKELWFRYLRDFAGVPPR